ncbi:MAG TPA: hypothetical protein VJ276_06390, partial [Thermoanaerobaculia bacterium]|nr:hypothetical protein [Thermoanaerobaculia bacterium]
MIVVFLLLPLVVFRGRLLWRWYLFELATHLFAWIIEPQLTIDLYFAYVLFYTVKLAAFAVVLANAKEVRWSANRAAVIAALVYALMVPAMMRTPIDGDEPYYLLATESLVRDHDLDLANQYRDLARSATGRTDLQAQFGDPLGPHGERPSRHEPFLSILMIPGLLFGGLRGAIATIALFGVLLVRSTVRMLEDEGIDDRTIRAVFPFFAFGPPVIFYAARIWPEVPGAWFFVEALRGVRQQRPKRWLPALLGLVLLKLRFLLIGLPLAAMAFRRKRVVLIVLALTAIPAAIVFSISGSVTNVHHWRELLPYAPKNYLVGLCGLLVDGAAGIAFQAPFYLIALAALARWRRTPEGFRLGVLASLLYILYLLPRSEWHGGWSPPLRYIVFLMPVLALGAAAMWERVPAGVVALLSLGTIALVAHGVAFPWRLFHIANGENPVGEWLSLQTHLDWSRFFPSFIRVNEAAWIGVAVLLVVLFVRLRSEWVAPAATVAIAALAWAAAQPPRHVEFEDAHVIHKGGELYPPEYTVARFSYRGGWLLREGDSLTANARKGRWTIQVRAPQGAALAVAGHQYDLPPT